MILGIIGTLLCQIRVLTQHAFKSGDAAARDARLGLLARLLLLAVFQQVDAPRSKSRMSLAQNAQVAAQEELPKDVAELADAIGRLPAELRTLLQPLMTRVVDSTKRRRRILALVQDALGQLRLDMKYLVFDLEATRRERDSLKSQSEGDAPPMDDMI
jgi:hypothetical protein